MGRGRGVGSSAFGIWMRGRVRGAVGSNGGMERSLPVAVADFDGGSPAEADSRRARDPDLSGMGAASYAPEPAGTVRTRPLGERESTVG
jgi:hypothetical protein